MEDSEPLLLHQPWMPTRASTAYVTLMLRGVNQTHGYAHVGLNTGELKILLITFGHS
jgi:hypothetical protein